MRQFIKKGILKISRLSNRQLNKKAIENKVFCIGLHKTGTTTLANYLREYGFRTTHSIDWCNDDAKLELFDFFSDGGSHFDGINEFDYEKLFHTYKNSKFILQTRDPEKWVISKLNHAGWKEDTIIQENDPKKITHKEWTFKSLLTVQSFIKHKFNYEKKVLTFFKKHAENRILVIDITQKDKQASELKKLKKYLNLKSVYQISLPHSNKRGSTVSIGINVHDFIKQEVKVNNAFEQK